MTKFNLFISYSQIAVFDFHMEQPFNDWTKAHVRQGFSWRPGSVSFQTSIEGGTLAVSIAFTASLRLSSDALRAIQVPFVVPTSGLLGVGSISDIREVTAPPGNYALIFETWETRCHFTFVNQEKVEPRILRGDGEFILPNGFLMEAESA